MRKTFRYLFIAPLFSILFFGCIKGEDPCQEKTVQSEQAAITAYAAQNGITPTMHPSGINYQIITQGSGPAPTVNSMISVKYTGKLLNGTKFDESLTPTALFTLSGAIQGWQLGVPLINEGGIIKLIIPSSLAYGCVGSGAVIPPYSVLYFEVELVDVQ
jgi:FKBP-type peptidyl-prolyl cis-trans isomerase